MTIPAITELHWSNVQRTSETQDLVPGSASQGDKLATCGVPKGTGRVGEGVCGALSTLERPFHDLNDLVLLEPRGFRLTRLLGLYTHVGVTTTGTQGWRLKGYAVNAWVSRNAQQGKTLFVKDVTIPWVTCPYGVMRVMWSGRKA